jgi:hydrogenase/urease accessory protein HupE
MSNVVEAKFGPEKEFIDFFEKVSRHPMMLDELLSTINAFIEQEAEAYGMQKVFIALMIMGKIAGLARNELPSDLAEMLIATMVAPKEIDTP